MYYKLEGYAYRSKANEGNLVKIDKVFEDEEPCVARNKCLNAYLSYIDVFLQSVGKEYVNHEQAEEDLQDFFVKNKDVLLDSFDYDKFIDIKFIFDPKDYIIYSGEEEIKDFNGEILIHTIGSTHNSNLNKSMCLEGLKYEYGYYYTNGYFCEKNIVKDKKGNEYFKTFIDYSQFEDNDII